MSEQLLYFTIIQCYSTISPLILPFGILSLILALLSSTYTLFYVSENSYEGGGNFFRHIFGSVCAALLIYQITLLGVFSINLFPPGSITFLSIFLTLVYWYYLPQYYARQVTFGVLDQLQNLPLIDQSKINHDEFGYKRPSTIPFNEAKVNEE